MVSCNRLRCDRYLRSVDKFNEWTVSAFITPGSAFGGDMLTNADGDSDTDTKFVLLHESKNEEGIRGFFHDVWELYVKVGCSSSTASKANEIETGDAESLPDCPHCHP